MLFSKDCTCVIIHSQLHTLIYWESFGVKATIVYKRLYNFLSQKIRLSFKKPRYGNPSLEFLIKILSFSP